MGDLASLAGAAAVLVASTTGHSLAGEDIAKRGNNFGAPACASCHGPGFKGDPSIAAPPIAGLPAGFIVRKLDHFAGPDGHSAVMALVASDLSPTDRQNVAAYLSSVSERPIAR